MEHFNKLTPGEAERLALLMEECGEVVQIIGKILRHGYKSYHPKKPSIKNRQLLEQEIGHVSAAYEIMVKANDISDGMVNECTRYKLRRVKKYLHHQ